MKKMGFSSRLHVTILIGLSGFPSLAFATDYTCYDSACIKLRLETAQPGDRIRVAPGDYLGVKTATDYNRAAFFYTNKSGTASAPISLEALDPSNKPVLHGNSVTDAYIFHILNANYWNIKDIVFHTASKGLIMDNVQNSVLDNIEVYNVGDEAVHFRDGSSNNLITNSYVHDTGVTSPGFGEGVYIGSADGTVKPNGSAYNQAANNNRVSHVLVGPNVRAEHVDIKERTSGNIVEDCIFHGAGISNANSADSMLNVKGNNAIIRNNQAYRENNPNILWAFKIYNVYSAGALSGRNNQFMNNTVHLDSDSPYVMYIQSGMAGKISNNVRVPIGNMYNGIVKDLTPPAAPAPGSTTYWLPVSDSYVANGSDSNKNFGLETKLYLKTSKTSDGSRSAFIKYDLRVVDSVVQAKLRVFAKPSASTTLVAYSAEDNWSEDDVTWNTQPTIYTEAGKVDMTNTSAFQFYEIDVTEYVQAQVSSDQIVTIGLKESRGKYTELNSWESPSNPPQLIITTPAR